MSAEEERDTPGGAPAKGPPAEQAAEQAPSAKADAPAAKTPGEKRPPAKRPQRRKKPAAGTEPAAGKDAAASRDATAGEKPAGEQAPAVAKGTTAARKPAASGKVLSRRKTQRAGKAPRRRVVRAHARYVRTSARKARMVCGHLRGKSVQEARAILAFTPRAVARDWSKLLESAVANAESNHELLEDDLIVRDAYADEGPTIKRFRPRAMGRATPIRKRTSHLTITLASGSTTATNKRQS
jgi:large subunit ribosomal protein L22